METEWRAGEGMALSLHLITTHQSELLDTARCRYRSPHSTGLLSTLVHKPAYKIAPPGQQTEKQAVTRLQTYL